LQTVKVASIKLERRTEFEKKTSFSQIFQTQTCIMLDSNVKSCKDLSCNVLLVDGPSVLHDSRLKKT